MQNKCYFTFYDNSSNKYFGSAYHRTKIVYITTYDLKDKQYTYLYIL